MELPTDISMIAAIIQKDWKNIPPVAAAHLKAMHRLHSIYDRYGNVIAKTVIKNFLNNAKYWRGDVARDVKTKLNELIS